MNSRIGYIAFNTFREAVRDRVLYNLIAFALLLSGAAILVGEISIDIERLVVVNLGLTAVSLFGVVIAIFIGIGLVSKEIDKRTLYTVLSRPVRRSLEEYYIQKLRPVEARKNEIPKADDQKDKDDDWENDARIEASRKGVGA